jgi:hypothetical protein
MAILKLKNETDEILMYKIDIDESGAGEAHTLEPDEVRTVSGDYIQGTKVAVWWKRGAGVTVSDCEGPGCNPGRFVMSTIDYGIRFGTDPNFPEQAVA